MRKIYTSLLTLLITGSSFGQLASIQDGDDTTKIKELSEVIITATRTERKLGNVAVPVRIIQQKTIQQAGSLRLKDILQEQAGLFITSGFGAGVQMQGLNPDYTLILIDGEPVIGRTAGVLDLNRLTVGNIRKIEIVKGPSSSLYGSEAMAGVINIITDQSFKKQLNAGVRYGFGNPDNGWAAPAGSNTFKNTDINLNGSVGTHKLNVQFFSNANYNDGFSYRPFSSDRISQPIWRLTNRVQVGYKFSDKTKFSLSVRHAYDHIKQEFAVSNNGSVTNSYGREANSDLNINPIITHAFNQKIKSSLRLYGTFFNGSQRLKFKEKPDSSYKDEFQQNFYRAENQTDFNFNKATLSIGMGYITDQVQSTRYDDFSSRKQNNVLYAYSQYDWAPSEKITLVAGIRYDDNKLFAAAFSPKLALRYKPGKKLLLNASIGRGFKAPDFRQLYLNFTNNAAGGYSVLGTIDAVKIITELQSRGLIAEIKEDFYRLKELKPEFSTGINAGGTYYYSDKLSFNLNLFRNDIEELIDVRQVATKSTGAQVFSYVNIKNGFTEGAELEINWQPFKVLKISSGYQYLRTADKEELKNVKAGKEYTRNDNGTSRILNRNEYIGLPNRSKHMANLKFTYENEKNFFTTARFIYRSRWAVANSDGNGVYNTHDEFAKGFLLINLSAGKEFQNGIRLNAGMDNIFNYQDKNYLPNLGGRTIYLGAQFKLLKSKKQ
jgi:outer membrane receptor for ferrienterochelin and colicins